ncbi:hypothetical protein EST38_g4308 [Candolleomyces aberdarensis]|uniref:Fungal-type protein kinase domain-containing protein n=1 Tax=Candolleomyces aberdarensis TaxID=2316362 RepID=A0A4Q2DQ04_9AGAR|nr:hypothetical protein EST38_g4308 [Candolleomyces aberdarensis]
MRLSFVQTHLNDMRSYAVPLKFSWPLKARINEIEAIKYLHSVIPDLADHLPALQFSDNFTVPGLDLPWTKLDLTITAENHKESGLHILASKLYIKLWKAGSVEAFKQAWLDCVECHYQVWTKGEPLHRDLSENNLMLYLGKDGKVKGVLNDWDIASFKNALGQIDRLFAAHHRTGTPPFMAMDLLASSSEPPTHLYRHELESFFYILLWGALHYDVVVGIRHPTVEEVKPWEEGLDAIRCKKVTFFSRYRDAEPVFKAIRPEFQGLRKEWIEPLYWLIKGAYNSEPEVPPDQEVQPAASYDYDTYGGRLTFWTFMKAIKQEPRWARKEETELRKEGEIKQETKEKVN